MDRNDCALCCQDMDIPLQHLLLPAVFLDADGLAFMAAHGIDRLWKTDEQIHFRLGDLTIHMTLRQLLLPETFCDDDGLALFHEHGLQQAIKDNLTVRLLHRCDQLDERGLCRIYETRPRACREFDCATRTDCSNVPAKALPLALVH